MEAAKKQPNFLPLLGRLAKEPVILEYALAALPLTKLAEEIDQAEKKADAIGDDELKRERLKASVERCREAFALLLLEIPAEQMETIQKQSITQLLTSQPASAPAAAPKTPPKAPPSIGGAKMPPKPAPPGVSATGSSQHTIAAVAPPPQIGRAPLSAMSAPVPPAPPAPVSAPPPAPMPLPAAATPAPEAAEAEIPVPGSTPIPAPAPAPTQAEAPSEEMAIAPSTGEPTPGESSISVAPTPVVPATPEAQAPAEAPVEATHVAPLTASTESESLFNKPVSLEPPPVADNNGNMFIDEPSLVDIPIPAGVNFKAHSKLTKQWLDFGRALEQVAGSKLPMFHLNRLILQHHVLALENECQEKLAASLKRIWPQRHAAVLPLMDPNTQSLAQGVHDYFRRLQTEHSDWTKPFDISMGWLQVMLRYWLSQSSVESFQPSLAECGFIVCLFGHDSVASNTQPIATTNLLGVTGVDSAKLVELGARLGRLHRYRNLLFSIRADITPEQCAAMKADLTICFDLIEKLQLPKEAGNG